MDDFSCYVAFLSHNVKLLLQFFLKEHCPVPGLFPLLLLASGTAAPLSPSGLYIFYAVESIMLLKQWCKNRKFTCLLLQFLVLLLATCSISSLIAAVFAGCQKNHIASAICLCQIYYNAIWKAGGALFKPSRKNICTIRFNTLCFVLRVRQCDYFTWTQNPSHDSSMCICHNCTHTHINIHMHAHIHASKRLKQRHHSNLTVLWCCTNTV